MSDFRQGRMGSPITWNAVPNPNLFTLDASTDAVEYIFAHANHGTGNDTITHGCFRYGARTGTPPTYRISLQGVDASGNPDGTIKGGGSPVSATFTPPASAAWDGTWQEVAFANSYSMAPGEKVALVIDYSTGTIDGSNNSSFTTHTSGVTGVVQKFPYAIQNNATARTRQTGLPIYGYKSASEMFGYPFLTTSTVSPASNLEVGFEFTHQSGWGATFTVAAIELLARLQTVAKTMRVALYDTDGTSVLQSVDLDTDFAVNASGHGIVLLPFDETTLSALTFGSTYSIGIYQVEAGGNLAITYLDVNAAADWNAWGGAQDYPYVSRATPGSGAWTRLTTRRIFCNLVLADWTEPSGSGGVNRALLRAGVSAVG